MFEGGKTLTVERAKELAEERAGDFKDEYFAPLTKKAVAARMLRNLLGVARREQDEAACLRYLDVMLLLEPDAAGERFLRAGLRAFAGRKAEALADVKYLEDHPSDDIDERRLRELRRALERE